MGIGSVTSTNSMSSMQMITAASTDPKIKNVQNEITDTEQQLQKVSSEEDLSANEKADERKKLQKEISSLNTELKQYQEELRKSQKREAMLAELREEQAPSKEEDSEDEIRTKETSSDKEAEKNPSTEDAQQARTPGTVIADNSDGTVTIKEETNPDQSSVIDTAKEQDDESKEEAVAKEETKTENNEKAADSRPTSREMRAMVSADSSIQQTRSQGTIIARTSDGIAILKEQIDQAKQRGEDTEKKQAELDKMEKREEIATAFQFSILGEANNAMKSAVETNADGTLGNADNNAFINAMKISQQEEQAAQQRFYVSFT